MLLKSILAAAVLLTSTAVVRADEAQEKALKEKIAAINKELSPIQQKVAADPDVKAARDAVKSAQDKQAQAVEAAQIKADPKAKDLLDQRKKLTDELAALQKADADAAKKAAGEKKEKKK